MNDKLKKDALGGNVDDGVYHRLEAAVRYLSERGRGKADEALVEICTEAMQALNGLTEVRDRLCRELDAVNIEYAELKSRAYVFPIDIGDEVKTVVRDEDEDGNNVAEIVTWTVYGLAIKDGKKYAIDDAGELYEIGTPFCIVR